MTERSGARNLQVDGLPDARIAVWNEGDSVTILFSRPLIAQIFPVQPVKPTVGQLNAIDVLNRSFRCYFYRECIALPRLDPLRRVEFVRVVHADYALTVRDQLAIQPNLGTIVNAGELQRIDRMCGR